MESYTESEILALKEFRSKVHAVLPDEYSRKDENLIRWLRARDLDVGKADELLKNSMIWREENKIDKILQSGLAGSMMEMFPFWTDGIDREGRVVMTLPFGSWDIRKSVEDDGPEKFSRYMTQMLETLLQTMKKMHENSSTNHPQCVSCIFLVDFSGFSYRQLANMKSVQTILQTVSKYEAHYPEIMHTCLVLNAPTIFSILFGMMKPLMTARTINKIQVFSSNRNEWEPKVLEIVSPTEIREAFGGTKN